jgi:hypothetical protein
VSIHLRACKHGKEEIVNNKLAIAVTAAVALVAGALIALFVIGPRPHINPPTHAAITVSNGNVCQQTVGGVPDALPHISILGHGSVIWSGYIASAPVTVTFPPGGSPFAQNSYQNGVNTGPPTGNPGDYRFQSITVTTQNGEQVTCGNPQGMGVHIDR